MFVKAFSHNLKQFYRAACNADAYSDEYSVRPSVCLSVRHKYCLPVPVFYFSENYNALCSAVSLR